MDIRKILCVTDLDGTLLNGRAALTAYAVRSLNAMIERGLRVSVATARTAVSALQILGGVKWNAPLVLMNGALIYDSAEGRSCRVHAMAGEAATAVIGAMAALGVTGIMYRMLGTEQQAVYEAAARGPLMDYIGGRVERYREAHVMVDSFLHVSPAQVLYFTMLGSRDGILRVEEALSGVRGIHYFSYEDHNHPGLWGLEIHSEHTSKRSGVAYLRELCGAERVIGFGDGGNDLPMFEACDVRVAVGNAKAEVLAAADFVCGTNEEDGVIRWIEGHVLGAGLGFSAGLD